MFNSLTDNFSKIFDKLTKKGLITESDVDLAMREIRIALLEADVALPVIKELIPIIKEKAIGEQVVKSISPGQMIVKIVKDELAATLGSDFQEINLATNPPAVIMMVGLQGSGKTTTSAKIALRLKTKQGKKVLLVSLDVARPAAQEQLKVLGDKNSISSLEIVKGENPITIAKRAMEIAKTQAYDVVILDTAGRLHIDEELMDELEEIKKLTSPIETLLVADSMTGQDAVKIGSNFHNKISLTGIILTRIDGDSRGGAALSMRFITGCPIKFLGSGEKITDLEEFHPERIASRILGMGDIVSLVERAIEQVNEQEAEKMQKKLQAGKFDLDDFASQLKTIQKIGGFGGMLTMLPGINKLKAKLPNGNIDEKALGRQQAIISSMTKQERKNPKLLNGSRRKRIAIGSGVNVSDVNRLLKQYLDISTVMKKMSKMDKKSLLRNGLSDIFS